MTTERVEDRSVLPHRSDPIRIVPLNIDQELLRPVGEAQDVAPATPPQLTYRGGPLLTSVKVFTVFWGAQWSQQPLSDTVGKINDFFDAILTSELIDQLAEYSVSGQQIGHGSRIGTATVTTPAPGTVATDSAIQHLIQQEITTGTLPAADPQTLYFVYTPPGVAIVQGGDRSCQAFCGYHNDIGGQLFYAAMPYPGCQGCTGSLDPFAALTSTSSHELCEAITDAVPGQGWYDDANGEIGDICAWTTKTVAGYTVQLEWSNAQNSCV
jgi:hypothetical protein